MVLSLSSVLGVDFCLVFVLNTTISLASLVEGYDESVKPETDSCQIELGSLANIICRLLFSLLHWPIASAVE